MRQCLDQEHSASQISKYVWSIVQQDLWAEKRERHSFLPLSRTNPSPEAGKGTYHI